MRQVNNWTDLNIVLKELYTFKDSLTIQNINMKGRRITNSAPSVDLDDCIVRRELSNIVQQGSTTQIVSGGGGTTYDKITFGVAVGTPAVVGDNRTPPYIWSNSKRGRPLITLIAANIPPEGSDLLFNIKLNGNSILTSGQVSLPSGTPALGVVSYTGIYLPTVSFVREDVLSIETLQIGTVTAGQDINIVTFCSIA